jgi:hypothetical protein
MIEMNNKQLQGGGGGYKSRDGAENGNSETWEERITADSIRDIDSCWEAKKAIILFVFFKKKMQFFPVITWKQNSNEFLLKPKY